ncbi:unnamed protein product [Cyclocybe aegerita]|uniref:DUF6534 domain-containing protein n=1 Tax=Cyclocybe aegerita TaxID=1973307 RepID=A0A8S0VUI0_CYCAE|nr:unnamed protein product [Cyclocybe aegerita]
MAEIFFEEQLIQRALFPALDNTFGVLYLGVTAAALLWGVGTSQTYWYLSRYPMDPPLWRVSVVVLWILNTTHQVMITHIVYHYLVTNYFNPAQLLVRIWSLPLQAVLQHTAALISQFFFLVQIWRLSKGRWYLVIAPILFMFSTVGVGMVWVAKVMSTKQIQVALREYGVFSEVASAGLALANISLAATIVYLLHTARTGARKSDGVLTRIMIYTINTGAVTSICSILSVATAIALPNAFFLGHFISSPVDCELKSVTEPSSAADTLRSLPLIGISTPCWRP